MHGVVSAALVGSGGQRQVGLHQLIIFCPASTLYSHSNVGIAGVGIAVVGIAVCTRTWNFKNVPAAYRLSGRLVKGSGSKGRSKRRIWKEVKECMEVIPFGNKVKISMVVNRYPSSTREYE